ncbi:MAG: ribosome assembly RNA-binding protein YhbY [Firmicutes bacterium]|nr:ribosome assembly RNA-binding protein YhbY [Bacillota bacterium]
MISSKQRSYLRGLANPLEPIFQVGKSGVSENVAEAINDALQARELIKVRVLKNVAQDPREVAEELAQATGASVIQVIGQNIVLYRRNPEEPVIDLP